ncbi:olfactory receptor 4E1-like [Seriola lalandi dorsalis]|uniref:olfactory receptor 4E1-like n=1 Tax=Seriola lalandi dorsalis TaxID=1841481 RepID=UPI000C6F854E|nr:olfactory receptor 4E1-like [Seriola lalandi dorsalis]
MFFLSGLNETRSHRFPLFTLTLLCYCVILLVNICLIATIILDKNLHEPMYILLCTFCMNGLYGTTGFYPKFLWDLLSPLHIISYSGCLVQALVMYSFACSDLSILAVMAYDRYVAICRPIENRAKFMQTCVPHLFSLLTFLLTILFDVMSMRFGSKDLPRNLQNFVAIEFLVIPPIMNPLIYGFKLTKIRNRILAHVTFKIK